ncbi:MAG TPA: hypothetical protein VFX50_13305 [Gemmatimonadales bacterium]|nr:hypothetical protein [Gemmatimonadales bacterium]
MRPLIVLLLATACLVATAGAQGPFVRIAADGHSAFDRGTGLIHFRESPGGRPRTDTLVLRAAPHPDADVAALFLCEPQGDYGWSYAIAAPETLVPNVLEFDYEIAGMPIDSVTTVRGHRWARVIVGARDAGGRGARRAWAQVDTTAVSSLAWADYLPRLQGVFALAPARTTFARSAGGRAVASPFSARFDAEDHWMEVQERRGAWLKVRFLQPAGACGDEPPADQVVRTLWVRFLDARGRPAVWYYTRGC